MKREQEGLLLLLKEIDVICRNNDITYYVSGGTVIGAARHEGFIPWDDDIDIYMTRDNWNRFREAAKTQLLDMRAVECWEDNDNFFNLLGRYMNKATTQIHQFQLYGKGTMGQLVDLFVLDPMINDDEAIRKYRSDVMLISDLMNDLVIYSNRWTSCKEYAALRDRIEAEGRSKVIRELIGRLEKYSEEEADCYILRWGGIPHVFPKEMFREPKYLKFEDMRVPVPTKMCEYLVQLYGLDWMYIPPHDEQLVHTDIFDPDQPYERFADLILPRVKNTETGVFLTNRKKEVFNNLQFTHGLGRERRLIEGEFIRRKLFHQIKEKDIDVNNADVLGNPEKMRPLMKDYIRMQSHRAFIGGNDFLGYYRKMNPIFVDIGDELLAAALRVMIRDGRISKAARLMQVRQEKVARPLEPCLESLHYMMDGLKNVQTMFEFNRLNEAEMLLESIAETESNIEVYKYMLEMLQRKGGSATERYKSLLDDCISKWPEDGDFRKFKGDERIVQQDYRGAIEEYTKALLNSKNGLFALLISKSVEDHKEELINYLEEVIHSTDDAASVTGAWKKVFEDDPDINRLYLKAHINGEDPFTNIFKENTFADDEDTVEAICSTYAESLGWNKDNVRCVLAENNLIKPGDRGASFFDDDTDISRYLNALSLQKRGDVREAYQIYLQLLDSEDPYVANSVKKIVDSDHKLFMKKKIEEDEGFFRADYALKYGDMPYEKFLKLLGRAKNSNGDNEAVRVDYCEDALKNPWFRLLVELIGICEQNGIQYMLGGAILQYLIKDHGSLPYDFSSMELIMDGTNAEKLIKVCRKLPDDRALECVLTNPRLRNIDMLYINTASTGASFNLMDRRKSLGIAVTVRIARPQEPASRRMTAADFDKFWFINYGYPYRVLRLNEKDRKNNRRFTALNRDGDKTTRKNFRNVLKQKISDDTKIIYIYGNVTRLMHRASLWKERKEAELFGVRIVVPSQIERYLNANYHTDSTYYDIPAMVIDETYTDHEGEEAIYSNDGFWKRLEENRQLTFNKKDQSREHRYNWEMANDVYDGITIQDRLLKEVDRLHLIFDKKAYTELLNQMDGYWQVLKLKNKYQIGIDSELEQLYLEAKRKI